MLNERKYFKILRTTVRDFHFHLEAITFFITLLDNHAFKTFSYAQHTNRELSSYISTEVNSCLTVLQNWTSAPVMCIESEVKQYIFLGSSLKYHQRWHSQ